MDAYPFLNSVAIVVAGLALNLLISAWMLNQTREGELLVTNWHLDGQPLKRASRKVAALIWPGLAAIVSVLLLSLHYALGSTQISGAILVASAFVVLHALYARAAIRAARRERAQA